MGALCHYVLAIFTCATSLCTGSNWAEPSVTSCIDVEEGRHKKCATSSFGVFLLTSGSGDEPEITAINITSPAWAETKGSVRCGGQVVGFEGEKFKFFTPLHWFAPPAPKEENFLYLGWRPGSVLRMEKTIQGIYRGEVERALQAAALLIPTSCTLTVTGGSDTNIMIRFVLTCGGRQSPELTLKMFLPRRDVLPRVVTRERKEKGKPKETILIAATPGFVTPKFKSELDALTAQWRTMSTMEVEPVYTTTAAGGAWHSLQIAGDLWPDEAGEISEVLLQQCLPDPGARSISPAPPFLLPATSRRPSLPLAAGGRRPITPPPPVLVPSAKRRRLRPYPNPAPATHS